jgi:hypothetical protein
MSSNIFIWAVTVYWFISKGGRLVKTRLLLILDRRHNLSKANSALDRIYLIVLKSVISSDLSNKEKVDVTRYLRHTLGTIAILFAPLLVISLGNLLSLETEEVE